MKFVQVGSVNHSGATAISVVQPHNCVKGFSVTRKRIQKPYERTQLKTNIVCFGDPTILFKNKVIDSGDPNMLLVIKGLGLQLLRGTQGLGLVPSV